MNITIDSQLATLILDRLGFSLQDLSLEFGDVVIPSGDVSHQLYYSSEYSNANLVGYVNVENGIYWSNYVNNHSTAQQAALDLICPLAVQDMALAIELELAASTLDYA